MWNMIKLFLILATTVLVTQTHSQQLHQQIDQWSEQFFGQDAYTSLVHLQQVTNPYYKRSMKEVIHKSETESLVDTHFENVEYEVSLDMIESDYSSIDGLKRGLFETTNKSTVCNTGDLDWGTVRYNKCEAGRTCSVHEIKCNGTTYFDHIGFLNISESIDIKTCLIKKLRCNSNPKSIVQSDEPEIYDVSAHGKCYLEKVNCFPSALEQQYPLKELIGNNISCRVQVRCGRRTYGYDAFDLYCSTQELNCGNVTYTTAGVSVPTENCTIHKKPCDSVGSSSPDVCISFEKKCEDPPYINLFCPDYKNYRVSCKDETNVCQPKEIICGGEIENAETYNETGLFSFCESIRSLSCSNGQEYEFDPSYTCQVTEVNCDGNLEPFFGVKPTDGCSIAAVSCFDQNTISCKTYKFGCSDYKNCKYVSKGFSCQNYCYQSGKEYLCNCPFDKIGDLCNYHRSMNCKLKRIAPSRKCDEDTTMVDDDPMCYKYKSTDVVNIKHQLQCSQKDFKRSDVENDGFEYLFMNDYLAYTEIPHFDLELKLWNFDHLASKEETMSLKVTQGYLTRDDDFVFDLDLSTVTENVRVGNRIYAELRLTTPHVYTLSRLVIDVTDLGDDYQLATNTEDSLFIIAAVSALIVLGAIGAIAYRRKSKTE
eukprot:TRINITY_DN8948_c0_g1_i1.p1 TRINITY_DN8948_c0_g1~~TRINITY_DN8948_c0_g1_i1.p1  ORF type:complete len:651 (-),score=116.95 TRINITY_DN8948_c0_g1_i1:26-1978(-)